MRGIATGLAAAALLTLGITAAQQPSAAPAIHAKAARRLVITNAMVIYGNTKPAYGPVDIVVQDNTKANMEKMDIFKQNNGRGMPKKTFKDTMTLGSGKDRVDLYYFGRGHTNGDAWIVFPDLRVAHAGDIFSGKNLPLLDMNNGGSGVEIGDSLARAHDGIKNVDTVITGHSTLMTWNDVAEYAQFNKDFLGDARAAAAGGKSADQFAATWKADDKYKGYNVQDARLKPNAQAVYKEIGK